MVSKTIKVSNENYLWLLSERAKLQKQYNRPVTFNDVIDHLRKTS